MCRDCERLKLLLKLKRGALLRTPVSETARLNELCDDINRINVEFAEHQRRHCYWWLKHRRLSEVVYAGGN